MRPESTTHRRTIQPTHPSESNGPEPPSRSIDRDSCSAALHSHLIPLQRRIPQNESLVCDALRVPHLGGPKTGMSLTIPRRLRQATFLRCQCRSAADNELRHSCRPARLLGRDAERPQGGEWRVLSHLEISDAARIASSIGAQREGLNLTHELHDTTADGSS